MNKDNIRRNYITPLGHFRGALTNEPNEFWKFIHEQRLKHGLSSIHIEELTGVSQSSVSKGERGGVISIQATMKILELFGKKLIMVDVEEQE